jgi:hypothetical protein
MTDTLPPELSAFGRDLEHAAARDLRRRRRTRLLVRGGAVAACTVAIAAAAAVLPSGHGHRTLAVARAAAALDLPRGEILHMVVTGHQTGSHGAIEATWQDESWQQTAPPYARRQIERSADGTPVETGSSAGVERIFDPSRNTVFELREVAEPEIDIDRASVHYVDRKRCVEHLRWHAPDGSRHSARVDCATLKASLVAAYRDRPADGRATMLRFKDTAGRERVEPVRLKAAPATSGAGPADGFRRVALGLLHSGRARVQGHARIAGRDAVVIRSADGHATYVVDAKTYDPIEWRTRGTGGGSVLRFRTYETLPADDRLLSIAAQHPGARVVRDADAYDAAEKRLLPNG